MNSALIFYDVEFARQFQLLPKSIQKIAVKKEKIFRINAFHPSLRLHKLKGKFQDIWSISITLQYRILFKVMGDDAILFISIGTHAVYE